MYVRFGSFVGNLVKGKLIKFNFGCVWGFEFPDSALKTKERKHIYLQRITDNTAFLLLFLMAFIQEHHFYITLHYITFK